MAEETSSLAEVALTPESEHEWELLRELVDFADRLVVAFIFADRFAVRVLRARMEREARERDMPFRLLTCDTADALRQDALAAILSPAAEHEITWLEAFGSEAELRGAWFFAAQRWNEHREPLRRGTLRALIVAAPIWAKPVIRLAAPDLWSITNLVIEPVALPSTTALEAPELAERHEGTPAERALAEHTVEKALALGESERRTWALINAVNDAVEAGAWEAADRGAESLDLSPEMLDRLASSQDPTGDRPDAFLPDLARSLDKLGDSLNELGRHEDALKAGHQAVSKYRRLAHHRPDVFLPELARSLDNLGRSLRELRYHADALDAAQEAVDLHRNLVQNRSAAALPGLARSLVNLGTGLSELGHHRDALAATDEGVDLYRNLARDRPDVFLPGLAMSLNNLGKRLSVLGRHQEALSAVHEAVDIFRNLARDQPEAFLLKVAMSVNNLGNRLSVLGHREDALAAAEESVALTAELARSRPRVFLPKLALRVLNLAARLEEAQRPPESSTALRDAEALLAAARSELESMRNQGS